MKFKIGDQVKILSSVMPSEIGLTGIITKKTPYQNWDCVVWIPLLDDINDDLNKYLSPFNFGELKLLNSYKIRERLGIK